MLLKITGIAVGSTDVLGSMALKTGDSLSLILRGRQAQKAVFIQTHVSISRLVQQTGLTFAKNFATATANSRMPYAKYAPTCHFSHGPHGHGQD